MSSNSHNRIRAVLKQAKEGPASSKSTIHVVQNGHIVARLEPITRADAQSPVLIDLLAAWRTAAADGYSSQFSVTPAGTRDWLVNRVLSNPDKILFWIRGDQDGMRLGHIGIKRLDEERNQAEIGYVVRGVANALPGVMEACVRTFLKWAGQNLGLDELCIRVYAHHLRAVRLFDRCGFSTLGETAMVKLQDGSQTRWVEQNDHPGLRPERRILLMRRRCREEQVRPKSYRTAA